MESGLMTGALMLPRPVGLACGLMDHLRRHPCESVMYAETPKVTIPEAPVGGILAVNEEPAEFPCTIVPGDLVMWIPAIEE